MKNETERTRKLEEGGHHSNVYWYVPERTEKTEGSKLSKK